MNGETNMALISTIMREEGVTELLVCPQCNQKVNMKILKSIDRLSIAGFTLVKFKYEYFTLCPKCYSSFNVDSKAAKLAESHTKDITLITENALTYCNKYPNNNKI